MSYIANSQLVTYYWQLNYSIYKENDLFMYLFMYLFQYVNELSNIQSNWIL